MIFLLDENQFRRDIESIYALYADEVEKIHALISIRFRHLVDEAFGSARSSEILLAFPTLTFSLFAHFPFWVSEPLEGTDTIAKSFSEGNYLLSIINVIVDPILDTNSPLFAKMLPLTYILFDRASGLLAAHVIGNSRPIKSFSNYLRSNMCALAREARDGAHDMIRDYTDASQDCDLLRVTWSTLGAKAAIDRPNLIDDFLRSHKMFDDVNDLWEDIREGSFSVLSNSLRDAPSQVEMVTSPIFLDHCKGLISVLATCVDDFEAVGMKTLSRLCEVRLRYVRKLSDDCERMAGFFSK